MATWCLTRTASNNFKKALVSGEINPDKLAQMSSDKRRALLETYVGKENSQQVNSLFESKMLLKNQKIGYITWAKRTSGITPKTKRDIISRIERMDKILDPNEEEFFLKDLASTRLGVDITEQEAETIFRMSKQVREAYEKSGLETTKKMSIAEQMDWLHNKDNETKRLVYGARVVRLDNYLVDLKNQIAKPTFKERAKDPIQTAQDTVYGVFSLSKSMKATLDQSYMFNQGYAVLTNYKTVDIWAKNSKHAIASAVRTLGGQQVWDGFRADLVSRPNYVNGLYQEHKVALNVIEEAFPSQLPEKIPAFGRLFKASEWSFNIFQFKNRADIFDMYVAQADRQGLSIQGKNSDIEGVGQLVNSLTARGSLGKLEPLADWVNILAFSFRKAVSTIDGATFYQIHRNRSNFARKEGMIAGLQQNLVSVMLISILWAFRPDWIERDPRSADFGKVVIGDTRISITPAGQLSFYTLIARLATQKVKSSTSGEIKKLNEGKFGGQTMKSVLSDYVENKEAPAFAEVMRWLEGRTFEGNKPTIKGSIINLYTPLVIDNYIELAQNPNAMNWQLGTMLDFVGIITNTYPNANIKTNYLPEGAVITNDSLQSSIEVYAKALGTDPESAFNRMFTGQKIIRVDDDTIYVERVGVDVSQEIKARGDGKNPTMKLDHTIPLELGGGNYGSWLDWVKFKAGLSIEGNSKSNLKLVPTGVWQSYTPVENALGRALKAGRIEKQEAQEEIVKFKLIEDNKERKIYGEYLIEKYK